jgi:AAA domain/Toprim domain
MSDRMEKFLNGVLQSAHQRVVSAPKGNGNITLNREAHSMGSIVASGFLTEETARSHLLAAAIQRGADKLEALGTINSGLKAGMLEPRDMSHVGKANGTHGNRIAYSPAVPDAELTRQREQAVAEAEAEAASKKRAAIAIWDASVPLAENLGEVYFRLRGFEFLPTASTVRFHGGTRAVIFPVTNMLTGEVVAIQRVLLNNDGTKREKRSLGSTKGCAVVFVGEDDGQEKIATLYICEGPETAWAVYEALNCQFTVIATLSAGTLGNVELSECIRRVVIVSDRGSEDAAIAACNRIMKDRPEITATWVAMPDTSARGTDANDILKQEEGASTLREIMAQECSTDNTVPLRDDDYNYGYEPSGHEDSWAGDGRDYTPYQNDGGAPDYIEPIVPKSEPPKGKELSAMTSFGSINVTSNNPYIVKGMIGSNEQTLLAAHPKAGKSVFALEVAYCVATGARLAGMRTSQSDTLYIALEGKGITEQRCAAIRKRLNLTDEQASRVPLYFMGGPLDLFTSDDDADALISLIRKKNHDLGISIRFIILDTLGRAVGGADENALAPMNILFDRLQRIIDELGVSFLLIDHMPKGDKLTPVGSVRKTGSVDNVLYLIKDDDAGLVTLKFGETRNGGGQADIPFKIEGVDLAIDQDGDPIRSAIVRFCEDERAKPNQPVPGHLIDRITTLARIANKPNPATFEQWLAACLADGLAFTKGTKQDSQRKNLARTIEELLKWGHIGSDGDKYWPENTSAKTYLDTPGHDPDMGAPQQTSSSDMAGQGPDAAGFASCQDTPGHSQTRVGHQQTLGSDTPGYEPDIRKIDPDTITKNSPITVPPIGGPYGGFRVSENFENRSVPEVSHRNAPPQADDGMW